MTTLHSLPKFLFRSAAAILVICCFLGLPSGHAADTTRTQVAPGFFFIEIDNPALPLRIYALEINISRPNVHIRSALASNRLGGSFENTLSMARRYDRPDYKVVGAINGDYFGLGDSSNPYTYVSNLMVKDNEYVVGKAYSRSQFGITTDGKPFVDMLGFFGQAQLSTGHIVQLNGVNRVREENHAIIYNHYFGNNTRTNEYGIEAGLELIGDMQVGKPALFVVREMEAGKGAMGITGQDYYVLSAHGTPGSTIANHTSIGDTLRLLLSFNKPASVSQLMGGGPRLITDGVLPTNWTRIESFQESHNMNRHPRTAVGISEDESRVYFAVIEGRQAASRGATMEETARIMKGLGSWNAVNLDGGGSSTIVVNDQLVNSPLGGTWQRPVGNALLAITEPYDGEVLGSIRISPKETVVEVGSYFNFSLEAYDLWNDKLDIEVAGVEWEITGLDAELGRGGFLAKGVSEGYVVARYQQEFTDTAYVSIVDEVSADDDLALPNEFHLSQNYPNPFNPVTRISFELPEPAHVRLIVYDLTGRRVMALADSKHQAGVYTSSFDATGLPSGVYVYELSAGPYVQRRKMTLLK